MKSTILFFALALVLGFHQVNAQAPAIQWQKGYGGAQGDALSAIIQTADSGYMFGGSSTSGISGDKTQASRGGQDLWIVKADKNGVFQWDKTIGGSRGENLVDMKQTPDGGYILLANSSSGISGEKTDTNRALSGRGGDPEPDYWVIKTDATGVIQWQRTMGGNSTERPSRVIFAPDGGYIVGGHSRSGIAGDKTINLKGNVGVYDFWILKLNAQGAIQWQKVVGGTKDEYMTDFISTKDGGFLAAGYANDTANGDRTDTSRGDSDYWIVKFNSNGNILWDKTFGGNNSDVLGSVFETRDSGFILAGASESEMSGDKSEDYLSRNTKDYWFVKVDKNGLKEWDKTIGGEATDEVSSVVQTSDGGYLAGGRSASDATGDKTSPSYGALNGYDWWIIKMDATGNLIWQTAAGGDDNESLSSILLTWDGGFMAGGSSPSGITGNKTVASNGGADIWVVKYEAMCESDTSKTYVSATICAGTNYTLPGGTIVSAAGTYYDTLNGIKCDSVVVTIISGPGIDTTVTLSNATIEVNVTTGATYQWINCGTQQAIPGETDPFFTPASTGNYAVVVTANGCSDTSSCYEVIPTGVHDMNNSGALRIYPNPAGSVIHIDAPFAVNIAVSSVEGKVVLTQENAGTINISNLSEGIYIIRATGLDGSLIRTEKLVKVK